MTPSPQPTTSAQPSSSVRSFLGQLLIGFLGRTVTNTSFRIVYPSLPSLARGLGIPLRIASLLVTLRMVAGLATPFFGALADRWGRRRVMVFALVLSSLTSLLLAGVGTFAAAVVAFALYGVVKAFYDPAVHAYVGDAIPYRERGRAVGVVELSWSGAWLLGVPASGFLIERFGWRGPWAALVGLGLVGAGLTYVGLPPIPRSHAADDGRSFFVAIVRTWRDLLRRRAVVFLLLTALFLILAVEIPFIVYGAWLESSFGLSFSTLGLASTVVGVSEATAELGTTVVTDRLGKRRSVLIGLSGLVVSLVALPWLARFGLAPAMVGVVAMMLTFEFAIVSLLPLATELAPEARALLLALTLAMFNLARFVGGAVGGWLWQGAGIGLHTALGTVSALLAMGFLAFGIRAVKPAE
jgi:predicted MFS family arabinose efflux permease